MFDKLSVIHLSTDQTIYN